MSYATLKINQFPFISLNRMSSSVRMQFEEQEEYHVTFHNSTLYIKRNEISCQIFCNNQITHVSHNLEQGRESPTNYICIQLRKQTKKNTSVPNGEFNHQIPFHARKNINSIGGIQNWIHSMYNFVPCNLLIVPMGESNNRALPRYKDYQNQTENKYKTNQIMRYKFMIED